MRLPPTNSGEQSSPQSVGAYFLRARRGADGSAMSVGATSSASTTFRAVVGDGRRRQFLSRRRLHQIAGQLRGDRAPAVGHAMPARPSTGVFPGFSAIATRERCSGDHGVCQPFHQPLLSAGNIGGLAVRVEATAVMMGKIRLATQDGELTPNERDALAKFHRTAEDELRQVGQLINRDAG